METSTLQQENAALKDQLETEIASISNKKQCKDVENDNLILLQQKGIYWFAISYCNKLPTYKIMF